MYRSLDFRRRVDIEDRYVERRHLHPVHELAKAPMLLGYPNLFASTALRIADDSFDEILVDADVVLAREPWQMPTVLERVDDETPVVFSSHNIEVERFGDISQPLFADRVEDRVAILEQRAVEESDAVVCTSERDARVYRELYEVPGEIIIAPNGTYEAKLREHKPGSSKAQRLREKYDISENTTVCLYVGSEYRPNVEAAREIVEFAREMVSHDYDVHFLVVGRAGDSLRNVPRNMTTTGYVEQNFESHFDVADIALNPMQSGGGTNIKLIDYFARSLPVISTPFGVRGVGVTDGKEVEVAELSKFPAAIRALGRNPEKRHRIGTAARELAAEQYTWEKASTNLRNRLHHLFG